MDTQVAKMNKCKCCPGQYRTTTQDFVLQTRLHDHQTFVIDDLLAEQCNICGHSQFTEDSLTTIKVIKEHVLREVQERGKVPKETTKPSPFSKLLQFFRLK